MTRRVRRRSWLGLTLLGSAAFAFGLTRTGFLGLRSVNVDRDMEDIVRRWLGIFDSPARLERLGRAYLSRYGNREGDTRATLHRIRRLFGTSSPEHVDEVRQWIRARVELDFAEGRVASVDGWFLSQSEAELCAAAVEQPRSLMNIVRRARSRSAM